MGSLRMKLNKEKILIQNPLLFLMQAVSSLMIWVLKLKHKGIISMPREVKSLLVQPIMMLRKIVDLNHY